MFRRLNYLVVFLLIFVNNAILGPLPAKAVCYYQNDSGYPPCVQGILSSRSSACCTGTGYCPSTTNPIYACCTNRPVADGCPNQDPNAPTPTLNPTGNCGHNYQVCCPGGRCLNADDSCISIPRYMPICLNQTQVGTLPGSPPPADLVRIFCGDTPVSGVRTALGCIPASNPQALIGQISSWAVRVAAGTALVTLAYAGFLITTAQGDVKKINEAKTFLMSALLGLLVIATALLLINFVGVKILGLSPLGFSF